MDLTATDTATTDAADTGASEAAGFGAPETAETWDNPYDSGMDEALDLLGQMGSGTEADAPLAAEAEAVAPEVDQDTTETDEVEAEAPETAEAVAEADEVEEAAEPNVDALSAAFKDLFPGRVVETVDDAREVMESYQERLNLLDQFDGVVSGDETLTAYLQDRIKGVSPTEAARKHFAALAAVPDPDEDPQGYAEFRAEQARAEERAKYEGQQQSAEKQKAERRMQGEQRAIDAFAAKQGEDFNGERFIADVRGLLYGDPETGRVRADKFDVLHRGLNFDTLVADAVSKAEKNAFARGVRSVRDKAKQAQTPPMLTGSRGPAGDALDPEARDFLKMAQTDDVYARAQRMGHTY